MVERAKRQREPWQQMRANQMKVTRKTGNHQITINSTIGKKLIERGMVYCDIRNENGKFFMVFNKNSGTWVSHGNHFGTCYMNNREKVAQLMEFFGHKDEDGPFYISVSENVSNVPEYYTLQVLSMDECKRSTPKTFTMSLKDFSDDEILDEVIHRNLNWDDNTEQQCIKLLKNKGYKIQRQTIIYEDV